MSREKINLKRAAVPGRDEMEKRLESLNTIHSPGSWYKEDVHKLLCWIDELYTAASGAVIIQVDPSLPDEVNEEISRRYDRAMSIIKKLKEEPSG